MKQEEERKEEEGKENYKYSSLHLKGSIGITENNRILKISAGNEKQIFVLKMV